MLLCHFKFSFKEDKLNFHFIDTLRKKVLCKPQIYKQLLSQTCHTEGFLVLRCKGNVTNLYFQEWSGGVSHPGNFNTVRESVSSGELKFRGWLILKSVSLAKPESIITWLMLTSLSPAVSKRFTNIVSLDPLI